MRIFFLAVLLLAFSSPIFADVRKWKDENGKTHYGDAPPMAGAGRVKTDVVTEDQIANGERMRRETKEFASAEKQAGLNQKCEGLLSELKNNKLGDIGSKTFTEIASIKAKRAEIVQEYELRCLSSGDRQASRENRSNEKTQNQLRQIQNTQQEMKQQQDQDKIWGKKCKPDGFGNLQCY